MDKVASMWKTLRPHLWVCLFFLAVSCLYFAPKFQGMQVRQGDVEKYLEMSQEVRDYYQREGVGSSWTGSMFSGMPTYTVSTQGGPANFLHYVEKPFKAMGEGDIGVVFFSLLACYILLVLCGASLPVALLGALAYAFSSYSIIILQAGHITKAWVMAYIPLVMAGFLQTLKGKYLGGGLLFAFALAMQIKNFHIQVTYYLALFCLILFIGWSIRQIRLGNWKSFRNTFLTLAVGVLMAVICNMGSLYASLELSEESIRGRSELSSHVDGKQDKSSGLDKDYAFAWSYGVGETFTLLIPNFYGGETGGLLDRDSHLGMELQRRGQQLPEKFQAYTYWGDQPFTSGPVYFGAVICLLFVLSLFVVKHPAKWWITGATAFFILLSWGRNFDSFNTFLFHYLPMYNKFRTVSMALVIPQFSFCLMAAWGLVEIFRRKTDRKELMKSLYYATGITGGLCLFFGLFTPLEFRTVLDAQYGMPDWFLNALAADRAGLLRADAFRSFFLILAAAALLYLYIRVDKPSRWLPYMLAALVFIDLWGIDRRYLNDSHYIRSSEAARMHLPTPADKAILADRDPSFRVLPLTDPFQNSSLSYYHKSIGGYNAAKLRRYQDLIDMKLAPEIAFVRHGLSGLSSLDSAAGIFKSTTGLNMLNMRYLVIDPSYPPVRNPHACGNAWFVPEARIIDNADEEMKALQTADPLKVALVDRRFAPLLGRNSWKADTSASIELLSYRPDRLEYRSRSSEDGLAVFSEVYYAHGWKAEIDGKEVPHLRADWILRAMEIPAGEHRITFRFEPDAYLAGRWTTTAGTGILLLCCLLALVRSFRKGKEEA